MIDTQAKHDRQALIDELERAGARFKGKAVYCPFHENRDTPAGSIHESEAGFRFHCFGCNFDGDIFDVQARAANKSLKEVLPISHNGGNGGNGNTHKAASITNKPSGVQTLWKSQTEADESFSRLPCVQDDPGALAYFAENYGLAEPELFQDDFRLFDYAGIGAGVVVRGRDIRGAGTYAFRSFERTNGKRQSRFLWGGESVLARVSGPGPLVITAGAEKALAAAAAGFNAISFLTGEKAPPAEWVQEIVNSKPERIIVAFDNDQTGRNATAKTLEAFGNAGFENLKAVKW